MGKGRLRVENAANFFYIYSGASMDRNYDGSEPHINRYRVAIVPISSKSSDPPDLFLRAHESALARTFFYPNPEIQLPEPLTASCSTICGSFYCYVSTATA